MKSKYLGIVSTGFVVVAGLLFFFDRESSEAAAQGRGGQDFSSFLRKDVVAIGTGVVDVKGGLNEVSSSLEGLISEVLAVEGDKVKAGQVLARQDNRSERIAIEQAEAELKIAHATLEATRLSRASRKRDLERLRPLYEIGAVTSQEFDRTRDQLQQMEVQEKQQELGIAKAEVALEQARFKFDQREIRSLVDGRVVAVKAQVGFATSSMTVASLFTIIPDEPLIIQAKIDIASLADISIGQAANVFVGFDRQKKYKAHVIRIASYLELPKDDAQEQNQNNTPQVIDVVLELSGSELLIGQRVNIELLENTVVGGSNT